MNTDKTLVLPTNNNTSSEPSDKVLDNTAAPETDKGGHDAAPEASTNEGAATQSAPLASNETAEEPLRPRVIVMHASVGSGHRSAANAIAQAFELMRDEARAAAGMEDISLCTKDVPNGE